MGGVIFIILGFISKIDIVKIQAQKVFSSTKSFTSIPVEKLREIERQL
jgi:hypothetical protein